MPKPHSASTSALLCATAWPTKSQRAFQIAFPESAADRILERAPLGRVVEQHPAPSSRRDSQIPRRYQRFLRTCVHGERERGIVLVDPRPASLRRLAARADAGLAPRQRLDERPHAVRTRCCASRA